MKGYPNLRFKRKVYFCLIKDAPTRYFVLEIIFSLNLIVLFSKVIFKGFQNLQNQRFLAKTHHWLCSDNLWKKAGFIPNFFKLSKIVPFSEIADFSE